MTLTLQPFLHGHDKGRHAVTGIPPPPDLKSHHVHKWMQLRTTSRGCFLPSFWYRRMNRYEIRDQLQYVLNVNLFPLKTFSWVANKTTVCVKEWQDVQTQAVQLDVWQTVHGTDLSDALRQKKKERKRESPWRGSCHCPFQSSTLVRLQINVVAKLGVELDLQVAQQLLDRQHPPLKAFDLLLQSFLMARQGHFILIWDAQIFLKSCCFNIEAVLWDTASYFGKIVFSFAKKKHSLNKDLVCFHKSH